MTVTLQEGSLSSRILALFFPGVVLSTLQVIEHFPDENPDSVKAALYRLRGGEGGKRYLRVKSYIKVANRSGMEIPVLELGTAPDVVRNQDVIELDDSARKAAAKVRAMREELKYRKEMKALDW